VSLTVTTWNINSVRLRIEQVLRFLREQQPDVLCLQETKCPDDRFPLSDFVKAGYPHVAIHGQKGYHGVAVISRLPLLEIEPRAWCDKTDARYIRARLGAGAGRAAGLDIHNFYIPAGGDIPDPAVNDKFAHKLQFLDELKHWGEKGKPTSRPAIMVGDLNVAPYEHDVWSHKQLLDVVSHTPVETDGLEEVRELGQWVDAIRPRVPLTEKVYTWWSYRSPDWAAADKGRRLDHVWLSPDLGGTVAEHRIGRDSRGWERPSDHVPVTVRLDL
jgi:exodeoxyribonuclease-3